MYHKILVPLDGSQRAEAIMPHVKTMAACYGATIILLHVVDPPIALVSPYDMMPAFSPEDIRQEEENAKAYLQHWQDTLQQEGLTASIRLEHGPIVATVTEVAQEENVDMVAMASHGRTGLSQVFYGSVAAGILNRIDRPLLLVRA